jgi:hypothetical protein
MAGLLKNVLRSGRPFRSWRNISISLIWLRAGHLSVNRLVSPLKVLHHADRRRGGFAKQSIDSFLALQQQKAA